MEILLKVEAVTRADTWGAARSVIRAVAELIAADYQE
jgi:hypothetical protein